GGRARPRAPPRRKVARSSWVGRVAAIQNLAGLLFSATARYHDRPSRIAVSSQILNRAKSLMAGAPCGLACLIKLRKPVHGNPQQPRFSKTNRRSDNRGKLL